VGQSNPSWVTTSVKLFYFQDLTKKDKNVLNFLPSFSNFGHFWKLGTRGLF
jgi:hypothetical protein